MCYIPDSGQESYGPVIGGINGLELIDHHLHVRSQVLAVLHPNDSGVKPVIWDVYGAVELSLVSL